MKRVAILACMALVIGFLAISLPDRTLMGCSLSLQSLLPPHGIAGCGSERVAAVD